MVLLVGGTLVDAGTLLQKVLFLVGAAGLGLTAHVNGEEMLTTLQAIISLGGVLAFVPALPLWSKVIVLGGAASFGIGRLIRIDYLEEDRWWPIGGTGLLLIAFAFAISGTLPLVFNLLLATATTLVLVYNLVSFFVVGVRLQAIWIVLNTLFMLNPARRSLDMLGLI
jgi:hypothetical protein